MLDADDQRVGLALGDPEPRYQLFSPRLAQQALADGRSGTAYLTMQITHEDLEHAP